MKMFHTIYSSGETKHRFLQKILAEFKALDCY